MQVTINYSMSQTEIGRRSLPKWCNLWYEVYPLIWEVPFLVCPVRDISWAPFGLFQYHQLGVNPISWPFPSLNSMLNFLAW